ncbi:MAG: hypothetical protein WA268_08410 [Xanthobacteraceae bacterium]
MVDNTLSEDVAHALRSADGFLRSNHQDGRARASQVKNLTVLHARLESDIKDRSSTYLSELDAAEASEIEAKWGELTSPNNKKYGRESSVEKTLQETFEQYRLINGGALPRNISPVVYSIPLILVGVAEYYVNYSTFAAAFVPLVAIFATLFVGATFAVASHLHGAYLKQLSEIMHPSIPYRNMLDRRIAVGIATFVLLVVFFTVIYLRYSTIAIQLGIGSATAGTFGQPGSGLVWSRLGPTLAINLCIWALGTLYSWSMHERVPGLRDSYRRLLRANRKLERMRAPYIADERQIRAKYNRERDKNHIAIKDYQNRLANVEDMMRRLGEAD